MKATEFKLLEFLKKSPQFVIPIYQRSYSWSEKECQKLWEDIIRTGENDNINAYFVGSIVYVEKGLYSVSNQSQLLVIDGQQRLTTLTLIIEALSRAVGSDEPLQGFITGTFLASKQFLERKSGLAEKFLQTGKVDLNDILPPASMELLDRLIHISMKYGIKTQVEAYTQIAEYLTVENLDKIPALRIHTAIYAALAFQASNGRTTPPSRGVKVDVDMISGILPYCDAMLVDRENAHILTTNPAMAKIGYETKIFAPKDRAEFLQFLDDIIQNADPAHLSMVEEIYGQNWAEPYLTILEHLD